ncbi:Hypothetical predicted protein [Xyrichtys novacula]|uniref:Uncharacterized protein n=1 Tax=Xyrichtys novacula TaxID=13765 RepID=A0AAV1EKB8_XYRNO|nr:Hypothetical predicted protein [Xyrichtys novacula]
MSKNAAYASLAPSPAVSSHSCRLSSSRGSSQVARLTGAGGQEWRRSLKWFTAALHTSASSPPTAFYQTRSFNAVALLTLCNFFVSGFLLTQNSDDTVAV